MLIIASAASLFIVTSKTASTPQSVANSEPAPMNETVEDQSADTASAGSENNLVVKVDISGLGSSSAAESTATESSRIDIIRDGVPIPDNNGEAIALADQFAERFDGFSIAQMI